MHKKPLLTKNEQDKLRRAIKIINSRINKEKRIDEKEKNEIIAIYSPFLEKIEKRVDFLKKIFEEFKRVKTSTNANPSMVFGGFEFLEKLAKKNILKLTEERVEFTLRVKKVIPHSFYLNASKHLDCAGKDGI